jgi:site-specific recombinase XerD
MLDQYFSLFLKEKRFLNNCSPKTIRYFECSYKAFKRSVTGEELNKATLSEFVVKMRESGLSARSCNDYSKGMNSFFKWLYENEIVKELFKVQMIKEDQKVLRAFTLEEMKRIINYKPKRKTEIRLKTMVLMLIETGCRIEELLSLEIAQLDFENLLIKIMGKGRKERIIPMSLELRKILFNYLKKAEGPLVFPSIVGTKWNYQNAWRDLQNLLKKLEIDQAAFHTFRRTYARQYLKNGGKLYYLMKSLGHTRLETTKIYLDADVEDLRSEQVKTSLLSRLR